MVTLVVSIVSKAGEESRSVNRQLLTSDLKAFGRAIHEVVALSSIEVKRIGTENFADRYQKAEAAAKRLWGVDEGIRTLGRLPDWIGHAKPYPALQRKFSRPEVSLANSSMSPSGLHTCKVVRPASGGT
jgi:hypothetical protein